MLIVVESYTHHIIYHKIQVREPDNNSEARVINKKGWNLDPNANYVEMMLKWCHFYLLITPGRYKFQEAWRNINQSTREVIQRAGFLHLWKKNTCIVWFFVTSLNSDKILKNLIPDNCTSFYDALKRHVLVKASSRFLGIFKYSGMYREHVLLLYVTLKPGLQFFIVFLHPPVSRPLGSKSA